MASGGWLGNLISAPLKIVDGILGGGGTYSASEPEVRAVDLVQNVEAMQPSAPVMGSEQNSKKKRGISSLYVDRDMGSSNSSYTGRGGL